MARVNTGEYVVKFYDKYGAEVKSERLFARCYTDGVAKGEAGLKGNAGLLSFTLWRQVFNSLDERDRY